MFADGALPAKTKQLIAVAVAHVTQCPYCIQGHTKAARKHGATPEEIMEAVWVAAEMRAGGAWAHSTLALAELGIGATKDETGRDATRPAVASAEEGPNVEPVEYSSPPCFMHEL